MWENVQFSRIKRLQQVVLGDSQLDVLAARTAYPPYGLGQLGEEVAPWLRGEDSAAIDPAREVRGDRDVGGDRDDRLGDGQAAERAEHATERLLGRAVVGIRLFEGLGNATVYFKTADEAVRDRASMGTRRFRIEGCDDQFLVTLQAEPGSPTQCGLRLLKDFASRDDDSPPW